jgi:isopenicillin-N N-acyltransferase-like protein
MAADPIPVIEARGTHFDVGCQIGQKMKPRLQRILPRLRELLPPGVSWKDMLLKGRLSLAHSRTTLPMFVEELEGIADGADVPFEEVFLAICEELWEPAAWHAGTPSLARGCTDMAARGAATVNGATLIAHTNDLGPDVEEDVMIFRVQAGDEPEFLGVSVAGLGYSAGFNAAGISMTGNAVSCSDIRPGVPRLLIARKILASRRLGEAMDACLLPRRASNYNNVIADAHGECYSMEGSATDCEPIYIDGNIMAHANHYLSPPMRAFEVNRNYIGGSILRQHRATRLLQENYGKLSPELFRKLLADHANYPASICKHSGQSVTVFSIIIDLNQLCAWIGRGRACETTYYRYELAPWRAPADWPPPAPAGTRTQVPAFDYDSTTTQGAPPMIRAEHSEPIAAKGDHGA